MEACTRSFVACTQHGIDFQLLVEVVIEPEYGHGNGHKGSYIHITEGSQQQFATIVSGQRIGHHSAPPCRGQTTCSSSDVVESVTTVDRA